MFPAAGFAIDSFQFIERTAAPPAVERSKVGTAGIIPGDWGKVEPGWLAQPLGLRIERFDKRRQDSPVPLAGVAARQHAMEELGGQER
jgi:hypothetical protein